METNTNSLGSSPCNFECVRKPSVFIYKMLVTSPTLQVWYENLGNEI